MRNTRASSASAPPSRSASLDGLRALAVSLVLAFHLGIPGFSLGWLGVDIFFVLSGFLITTLLLDERRRTGSISLWRFWARRFLRLMPAYWLYLSILMAMMLLGSRADLRAEGPWTPPLFIASLWGYFSNYAPMSGLWNHQWLSIHLWSLAVEEQFYLVWPVLLALILCFRRGWIAAWVIVLAILVHRVSAPDDSLWRLLYTRGIGIAMGSALALTLHGPAPRPQLDRALASPALRLGWLGTTFAALVVLTILLKLGYISDQQVCGIVLPLLCLLFAGVVIALWYGPQDHIISWLGCRPLAWVGRVSYGVYLYHVLVQSGLRKLMPDVPATGAWLFAREGARVLLCFSASILLASLSYKLVEERFLKLKDRFAPGVVPPGAAASARSLPAARAAA